MGQFEALEEALGTEAMRSTEVEATREMRVVVVGSTLVETRAGPEDENVNLAVVIQAAVCVAAITKTLADLSDWGVRPKDAQTVGKR